MTTSTSGQESASSTSTTAGTSSTASASPRRCSVPRRWPGAKENLTPVIGGLPPFRAGYPKPFGNVGPHGAKWVLGSRRLQPRILPTADFPRVLSLQVFGSAGHPSSARPSRSPSRPAGGSVTPLRRRASAGPIVCSVANGYCGYCTTAEEYESPVLRGRPQPARPRPRPGSPPSRPALAREVETADSAGHRPACVEKFRVALASLPCRCRVSCAARHVLSPAAYHDPAGEELGWWELRWLDVAPGDLQWHEPLVRVDVIDGRGSMGTGSRRPVRLGQRQPTMARPMRPDTSTRPAGTTPGSVPGAATVSCCSRTQAALPWRQRLSTDLCKPVSLTATSVVSPLNTDVAVSNLRNAATHRQRTTRSTSAKVASVKTS